MGPKKHLGQHFLTAVSYAQKIADNVPAASHENILEIGPGRGALSVHLVKRFPLFHCVEIDDDVVALLEEKLGKGDWSLHRSNVLEFDFRKAGFPLHCVGNLPYSIGAHIIKKTLLYGNNILSCTFMVQREVAERIVAAPHTKQNGFLSIFCQFFGRPTILFHVPAGAFFPKPNVESSVFQIKIDPDLVRKLAYEQWEKFFAFVDAGFKMRRKMLVNVLGRDGGKQRIVSLLDACGIDAMVRPEDLGIDQWLILYKKSCEQ